jgi:hypothetical protein
MALSEDQRALLRLLLTGDTYEQVAEVLGTNTSAVRDRAREAVTSLEREGAEPDLAEAARKRLEELESGAAPAPAAPETEVAPEHSGGLPPLAWVTIAGALIALVVAFVVVQAGDESSEPTPASPQSQEDVVEVKLDPVGGSGASGTARIVRVADLPAIDVDISGLEPNRPNETYVLWLLGSGDEGLPIAFRDVGPGGRFVGRTEVPGAAAGLLPSIEFIDLSLAGDREATAAVRAAAQASTLPGHVGESVVRGALPG